MVLSGLLTMYCSILLLNTRVVSKVGSYSEMGQMSYGKCGRIAVDISLALSQSGFCCAYVFFIKENLN